MQSMTGFGQASGRSDRYLMQVGIRSVNHRHLELQLRLDEPYRRSEEAIRSRVAERLRRGRVEVTVEVRAVRPPKLKLVVNEELARALQDAAVRLREVGSGAAEPTLADFLRLPGSFEVIPDEAAWQGEEEAALLETVGRALDEVVAARRREGEALAALLTERLGRLAELRRQLEARREAVREALGSRLRQRLQELLQAVPLDEERLAQELALLVDRSDVGEELDRLGAHFDHFRQLLEAEGAVGRRLDFLTQEMMREAGTVGAKCRDAEMARTTTEVKSLVEQLREQVQNLE